MAKQAGHCKQVFFYDKFENLDFCEIFLIVPADVSTYKLNLLYIFGVFFKNARKLIIILRNKKN